MTAPALRPQAKIEPVVAVSAVDGTAVPCQALRIPTQAVAGASIGALLPGSVLAVLTENSGHPVIGLSIASGASSIGCYLYPAEAEELATLLLRFAAGGTVQ